MTAVRSGLCTTCSNNLSCTFWSAGGGAIADCLEFEAFAMTRPVSTGGYLSPMARSWFGPALAEIDSSDPRLCGTCRGRRTCIPSKSRQDDSSCTRYR